MARRGVGGTSWAIQVFVLLGSAMFAFWGFYTLDVLFWEPRPGSAHPPGSVGPWSHYLNFDPGSLPDSISELAGTMLAVFGIVITVVSIIVQLAADRYSGVARRFLRDRVNLAVLAFYVIACVVGVLLSVAVQEEFVPWRTLVAMLCATAFGLVLMAPYFGYVFWFLEPANVIKRIQTEASDYATRGQRNKRADAVDESQLGTLAALEELTDIASNSITKKDKLIASSAIDAIRDFALDYAAQKSEAQEEWFQIGSALRENPDFVAMDPESLSDLEARRGWVEWKALRQYLRVFNDALGTMGDINYLIAINTRYVAEAAATNGDEEALQIAFRYMNSYLRATLNARDVRTAYNVLNQYRLLGEALLESGQGDAAEEVVRRMNYYGHVAFDMKLPFVTETVAHDVASLCELANERGAPQESAMLEDFLELDQPLESRGQEKALLGVRKAQVRLAAHYLARGDTTRAQLIADDMRSEPAHRLHQIRNQLTKVVTKDFWEIIDRGRNFEYMDESHRSQIPVFFSLMNDGQPSAG